MTSDTPRTDSAEPQLHSNAGGWVRADFARELERELNDSRDDLMRTQIEMQLEIDRGEAEIERLEKAITNCLDWANNREDEWGERAVNAFAFLHAAINPPTNWEDVE
jgi:hypothetical protein